MPALEQRKIASVLFDEYHGEAWAIRPVIARQTQPSDSVGSSYAEAAAALRGRDFAVTVNADGPLNDEVLAEADVLVVAYPSEPSRARTVGERSPAFSADEIRTIEAFVARGGGLVVLGEAEPEKHGDNLNVLLATFGMRIENATIIDHDGDLEAPSRVRGELAAGTGTPSLLHLVGQTCFRAAGPIVADDVAALVLQASETAQPARAGLLAAAAHGEGRVVVAGDSELFGDGHLSEPDHLQLWLNISYWVAAASFRAAPETIVSGAARDPAWSRLRDETNALRRLQEPKGEVDLGRHDVATVRAHVTAVIDAIEALAPHFPHQQAYLAQVPVDLTAWLDGGCGQPDFTSSLALFRPEQERRDGIEHLVVFPMYTPNGSQDTRFEALIVRTPWPEFVALLEADGFDNDKYVPVQLVDYTDGYDSECAVLFPETVSVAGRPTNNFGGIFCDREAARLQRTIEKAAEILRIDLPPDAAALASSGDLMREAYILWDMIHDRWHSHGDLPFDPFMIRQRLPYWMYGLEELRVDLATYGSAGELVREGFPFARYVQYAIVFDRILRFPITGNRVRNYDGLGGQLLFAFLHQNDVVRWSDNRLLIDWTRMEEAIGALRDRVESLYRRGIDLSKVSYWTEAHDLVAEYVRPNISSQWAKDRRVVSDEADARAWVDRVLDDEFPLSIFYEQLKKKMVEEPALV